ncbi:hypothetical protein Droror1_Dr00022381 [Drosera rotundifolia]
MAEPQILIPFIIFFTTLFFNSSSSSRIPPLTKTSTLDVLASIQLTLDSIQRDQTVQQFQAQNNVDNGEGDKPISSLSLPLFPRSAMPKSEIHQDYSSLILSRLERDSARVNSLTRRLDLSLKSISVSDLRPLALETTEPSSLEGPVVSGTSQGSGEYFTRLGVGTPASQMSLVLDTGSDVSWMQCETCSDCYQQSDPIFVPTSSSSYSPITCDSPRCKALDVSQCSRSGRCLYEVSYGDGSYTVGDFVTETLSFNSDAAGVGNGDNAAVVPSAGIALGCGHNNEGLFVGAAGLLGLGGGVLSFPSQINATSFSYCLVDRDSDARSTLDFGVPLPRDAVTAPLLRSRQMDTFLYLGMSGISVGGQMLSVPASSFRVDEAGNGGVIVDSGTAVSRLQTAVYDALRDAFVGGTQHLPPANGVALFDTCYDLASMRSVEVPTVAFHFPGGKRLPLPAKNYVIPVDSKGTFCLAFAPTTSSLSIIGNVQQQGTRVGFDLVNNLVGFSPNKC